MFTKTAGTFMNDVCSRSFTKLNLILFFNQKKKKNPSKASHLIMLASHITCRIRKPLCALMHVVLTVFLFFCLRTTIQSMCLHVIKYCVYVCKVFGWVPQLFKQRLIICSLYFWDLLLYPSALLF